MCPFTKNQYNLWDKLTYSFLNNPLKKTLTKLEIPLEEQRTDFPNTIEDLSHSSLLSWWEKIQLRIFPRRLSYLACFYFSRLVMANHIFSLFAEGGEADRFSAVHERMNAPTFVPVQEKTSLK
ncbi:hypothetical protein AMECASPLE_036880 [Ameca splendens]|uniref:Uncharacterized protein n=1 Tax=Ameca splendens TaxID=208324 RepID=A0ABV1A435_9TELE